MFCPRCGQERVSQETSFCSQCGFLLTGAAELLERGGAPLAPVPADSPRARGVKFGIFMILLMLVVAPVMGMIAMGLRIGPWPIGLAVFLLGGGGLLRIIHALMFESKQPGAPTLREQRWTRWETGRGGQYIKPAVADQQLPRGEVYPLSTGHHRTSTAPGRWLDTSDLEPGSVTEQTTRQLSKERDFSD